MKGTIPARCLRILPVKDKIKARTALFFPGQGTQRVGMLKPWLDTYPRITKRWIEDTDAILNIPRPYLSEIIQGHSNRVLMATPNAQPAIFSVSMLILEILKEEYGFDVTSTIDVALGHSLGEFAALVSAGHLTYADALRLLRARAETMQATTASAADPLPTSHPTEFKYRRRSPFIDDTPEPTYGMVAVIVESPEHFPPLVEAIQEFLKSSPADDSAYPPVALTRDVSIANINAKNQLVLSGYMRHIRLLLENMKQFGGHDPRFVILNADSPFHSQLMQPAARQVRQQLQSDTCPVSWPGHFPVVSNVSARPFRSKDDLIDLVARSCCETVNWLGSIQFLDQEYGVRRWVGIGPSKVGRNLVGKEVGFHRKIDKSNSQEWTWRGGGVWAVTKPGREIEELLRGLENTEGLDAEVDG
ncbi:MAG: AP-3 complex subunit mu [Vezdaea aestivalis]|nr:MAG: AP-3 complex subunit mu [Vezdaea aestivalis]